jgi:hypothetical protein
MSHDDNSCSTVSDMLTGQGFVSEELMLWIVYRLRRKGLA